MLQRAKRAVGLGGESVCLSWGPYYQSLLTKNGFYSLAGVYSMFAATMFPTANC